MEDEPFAPTEPAPYYNPTEPAPWGPDGLENPTIPQAPRVPDIEYQDDPSWAEDAASEGGEVATESAEVATEGAELAGATAEGLAGAGVATTVAAGAAALGAGMIAGYEIEQQTHIGSDAGQALFDHSNDQDAHKAAESFTDAGDDWDKGNYLSAAGDVAEGFGHMAEGLWDGKED